MKVDTVPSTKSSVLLSDLPAEGVELDTSPLPTRHDDTATQEKQTTSSGNESQGAHPNHEACYPKGGSRAWLVVLASFAGTTISLGTV